MIQNLHLQALLIALTENLPLSIFLATLLETFFPPIPSEIVLPLSGYLISIKNSGILWLLFGSLLASFGSTAGNLIHYLFALFFGRKFIEKYGKYFFIDKRKLKIAENWFKKYGNLAVFFGRMAPGIRELVSIPAGILKMPVLLYLIYTFSGSYIWCLFLMSVGYFFGTYPIPLIERLSSTIFVVIIASITSYLIFRKFIKK